MGLGKLWNRAYDWILVYGPKILLGAVVFVGGMILIRFINKVMKRNMEKKRVHGSIRFFLQNLISLGLQIFLVVVVLQIVGLELTIVSAIMAGLTVAAGLALSGTLQNFVSGILILFLKPYRIGDNISAQGFEGTVTSIQLFYTIVTMFDNRQMVIPNGQLSNNVVVNLSSRGIRRFDIELRFGYATDIDTVKKIITRSVAEMKDIIPDPQLRIGVSQLENDRFILMVNVWTNAHGFFDTKLALNEKLIQDIKLAGVKFPGM